MFEKIPSHIIPIRIINNYAYYPSHPYHLHHPYHTFHPYHLYPDYPPNFPYTLSSMPDNHPSYKCMIRTAKIDVVSINE